jgi:hypothetical protein
LDRFHDLIDAIFRGHPDLLETIASERPHRL